MPPPPSPAPRPPPPRASTAFVPPAALPPRPGIVPGVLRGPRATPCAAPWAAPRAAPRTTPCCAAGGPREPRPVPGLPAFLHLMDRREAAREAAHRAAPAEDALSPEIREGLARHAPVLRTLEADLDALMVREGIDPEDPAIWSWLYRRCQPLVPRRVAAVLWAFVVGFAAVVGRRWAAAVRAQQSAEQLAFILLRADLWVTKWLLGAALAVMLVGVFVRWPRHSDAPRRIVVGFATAASLWLPAASALLSCGFIGLGLATGAVARLVMLPLTLWVWRDLSIEVRAMRLVERLLVARALTLWRLAVTAGACVGGGALRAFALVGARDGFGGECARVLRGAMAQDAVLRRLQISFRFPVALSLFADPGGLACLTAIVLSALVVYFIYMSVFVTDFFGQRLQRECKNVLTDAMIARDVYMPNHLLQEERESLLNTGPPGVKPHFAMPTMMLSRPPSLDWVTMGVRTVEPPRFLQLLEEEQIMMKEKGMERWSPSRDQFVPLGGEMTEARRQRDFMNNWARPLSEADGAKGFYDFFESLEDDDEYEYNPETEEWVFTEDSKWMADRRAEADVSSSGSGQQPNDENDSAPRDDSDDGNDGQPKVSISFPDLHDPDVGTVV